jgi:hypothetical protein
MQTGDDLPFAIPQTVCAMLAKRLSRMTNTFWRNGHPILCRAMTISAAITRMGVFGKPVPHDHDKAECRFQFAYLVPPQDLAR